MPRAGRYRDRVRIERGLQEGARDKYGNLVGNWLPLEPLADFWGNMREVPGKERLNAGRLEDPATATLRLRYSPESLSIRGNDRVLARGHYWAVVSASVDPDGSRREVELLLERGGAVE